MSEESDRAVTVFIMTRWWKLTHASHVANSLIGSHLQKLAIELVEEAQDIRIEA